MLRKRADSGYEGHPCFYQGNADIIDTCAPANNSITSSVRKRKRELCARGEAEGRERES
jgi:hypothetical protein